MAKKSESKASDPQTAARASRVQEHESYLKSQRIAHTKNMVGSIDRYTISGLRLSEPKKPENGLVVTFEEGEAERVVAAVKKVLQARK